MGTLWKIKQDVPQKILKIVCNRIAYSHLHYAFTTEGNTPKSFEESSA